MIELGQKVKDNITGFTGIAIAKCEYLNGCISIEVKPTKLDKDGKMLGAQWIDEQRLTVKSKATTGGPQDTPPDMCVGLQDIPE